MHKYAYGFQNLGQILGQNEHTFAHFRYSLKYGDLGAF